MLRPDGYLNQNVAEPDEETAAARSALYARLGLNKPKPQKRSRTITQHVDDWLAAEKLNVGKGMVLGSWVDKEKGIKTVRWVVL